MKTLGIVRETKNKWERRTPLNPQAVKKLVKKGYRVMIQSSEIRIYKDVEYQEVGAEITENLSECDLILAVKEITIPNIISGVPHLFFSHTIKGQDYNMPLLQHFLDTKTTLFDYEKIVDEHGRRLVFFGKFAGNAGMIETLWGLGQRLKKEFGIETPFLDLKHAYEYKTVQNAIDHFQIIGEEIERNGLPSEITPLNIFMMGYGHVSQGAQEILSTLPIVMIDPENLSSQQNDYSNHEVYLSIFKEKHMVERMDGGAFDLLDYFQNGTEYVSKMEKYLDHCSVYVNAIYWEAGYPVFLSTESLAKLKKILIIGDITCDINGSVQATVKTTYPDKPIYIFDANTQNITGELTGKGVAVCAVDNLPCEFAKESSDTFSEALSPLLAKMLNADYAKELADMTLPEEIKTACITHQGKLQQDFRYLQEFLPSKK